MSGIVIRGLSKVYGDSAAALEDLDLEVQPGEIVVVVGPSGSGKTTLLRLVAGLDKPTAGTIHLGGRDLRGVSPRGRNVALVFQSLALYEHLTVEQNLAFALNAQTTGGWWKSLWRRDPVDAQVRQQVVAAASRLGIERLLGRRPAELSGGEQQRVALGRAIVRQPRALLLDEPLSSLDLPTRRQLRLELKELQRKLGVPTIYVTHDQSEALALGDRVAVLDRGRLVQIGTPDEVYHRPKTRFVAEFFGPYGMNLIEGEWIGDELQIRQSEGGQVTTLDLPNEHRPSAPSDGPVLLGIRPEDIELTTTQDNSQILTGEVSSVENLGESRYLHLRLARLSRPITVRVHDNTPTTPQPNTLISIRLRPERLHWFDPTSGQRITTH